MSKYIYMAGLLDGEGTIGIAYNQNKIYRSPYISVSSTTKEIIDWLKSNFGGTVCVHKTYQEHHKPSWSWRITKWDTLEDVLVNTLPHMIEPDKVRRGNLILSEYKSVTQRNGKYTPEQRSRKLDFENQLLGI